MGLFVQSQQATDVPNRAEIYRKEPNMTKHRVAIRPVRRDHLDTKLFVQALLALARQFADEAREAKGAQRSSAHAQTGGDA
jgi:hypothetical protein